MQHNALHPSACRKLRRDFLQRLGQRGPLRHLLHRDFFFFCGFSIKIRSTLSIHQLVENNSAFRKLRRDFLQRLGQWGPSTTSASPRLFFFCGFSIKIWSIQLAFPLDDFYSTCTLRFSYLFCSLESLPFFHLWISDQNLID